MPIPPSMERASFAKSDYLVRGDPQEVNREIYFHFFARRTYALRVRLRDR